MDHDEDHREPLGTYEDWLRDQRAANECPECGGFSLRKVDGAYVFSCCAPEEEIVDE
jgi:hypothetical protein